MVVVIVFVFHSWVLHKLSQKLDYYDLTGRIIMNCVFFFIKKILIKDVHKNFSFCLDEYLYKVLETKFL